ncbi:MAG: amino acid ABC transporter permease [Actinomycetota bacterium]
MTMTEVGGPDNPFILVNEPEGPPSEKLTPWEWIRKNLFSSWVNTLITLIFGPIALYLIYRFARFVFVTGRWDPVDSNLELFMIGTYPREERWRVVSQLIVMSAGIGGALGTMNASAKARRKLTGEEFVPTSWRTYASSYWSVVLFVLVLLVGFTDTTGPWLMVGAMVVLGVAGWAATTWLPDALRPLSWSASALLIVVSFQLLSGTGGWAWFYTVLALVPLISGVVGRLSPSIARMAAPATVGLGLAIAIAALVTSSVVVGLVGILVGIYGLVLVRQGDRLDATRVGLIMIASGVVTVLYRAIGLSGIDWSEWSGLHLTMTVAVASTLLAFPIGVLLALGRRSSLPAIRVMSVAYIEFFRGAPLITFLLAGAFFLGFFLNTESPLSLITRAIAAITLFSAAYIAEIVRGGLQAVPKGQVEAGLASGLSQPQITRFIVLPQALRAVIPAMVGQFISLFKDTSLLGIIALSEFLDVRLLVHAQEDFRGFGIAETMTFVAFGFWAFAFAMSRESQRLERRLGVGQR